MLVSKSVTIGVDVIQVIDIIRLNHLIHTTRPPFSPICCSSDTWCRSGKLVFLRYLGIQHSRGNYSSGRTAAKPGQQVEKVQIFHQNLGPVQRIDSGRHSIPRLPVTLVRLSTAFAIGIALPFLVPALFDGGWHPTQLAFALFAVGAVLVAIATQRLGAPLFLPVLLALVILGAWRATDFSGGPHLPDEWRDGDFIELEGVSTGSASPFGSNQAFPIRLTAISGAAISPGEELRISIVAPMITGALPDNHSRFHFAPGDRYLIAGEFDPKGLRGTSARIYASSVRLIEPSDSGLSGRIENFRARLADNLRLPSQPPLRNQNPHLRQSHHPPT